MGKYEVKIKLYSNISIYKNGIEYLRLERSNQFLKTKSKIYLNNELIFQYKYISFLCFSSLKIIFNKLSDKFKIKQNLCNIFAIYDGKKIFIKYPLLPFSKTSGKIFLENKLIGVISRESMDLSNTRVISINDEFNKYDLYILLLLLIELTHIDSE